MKNLLIYGPKQRSRQEILLKELSTYFDADGRRLNAMIFAPTRRKATELKSQILAYFERKCWDGTTGDDGVTAFNGSGDWTISFWKYGDAASARAVMSVVHVDESDATKDGDPFLIQYLDSEQSRCTNKNFQGAVNV